MTSSRAGVYHSVAHETPREQEANGVEAAELRVSVNVNATQGPLPQNHHGLHRQPVILWLEY